MTTEKTACILCSRNCGLTVEIDNGKFVKIKGDEAHPISKGYICQKAARLVVGCFIIVAAMILPF